MQDQASVTPDYDLGHYVRPLGRHRAILCIAILVGLVLGAAYTAARGKSYTSTAAVLVNNAPSIPGQTSTVNPTNGRTNGSVNLDTEGQLVKSSSVLNRAVAAMNNGSTAGGLRSRIDIVVPPNSTILRLSCSGSTATSAQTCAQDVAEAYLANRLATNKATISRAAAAYKAQLTQVKALLIQDAKDIQNSAPASAPRNNAFARQASDTTDRNTINQSLNTLATADTTPGTIISAAGPGTASKISLITGPIAGLILGFFIGIVVVLVRERRDTLVRNSDDLIRYGVPLIANSEQVRGKAKGAAAERAARTRFEQRIASVVAGAFDDDGGVVYIAPVSPDQSPDRIARRLASTLASVGHSVELVRADDLSNQAAPTARHGATTMAAPLFEPKLSTGDSELGWPGMAAADDERASAPVDTTPPLIDDAFATDPAPVSIPQLIEDSRRRAQFVIIEGDPAATDAQAYILTGLSDAAVLIVDPQVTTREDLDEVVDQIAVTGSELLGAVMWRLTRKQRQAEPATTDEVRANRETSELRGRRGSAGDDPTTTSRSVDAAR